MDESLQKKLSLAVSAALVAGVFVVVGFMLLPKGGYHDREMAAWKEATTVVPDPTVFPTVKPEISKPVDLAKAMAGGSAAEARGKSLYEATCASCHGAGGRGDGPAAGALKPPPRNFTSPDGWVNGSAVTGIFRTLSKGISGTGMVAYDTLPAEDRFALAHYVQSLGAFPHPADTPAEVAKLDADYHLSSGIEQPGKVAVPTVMKAMAEHSAEPRAFVPKQAGDARGAMLVRLAVKDPARVSTALAATPAWRTDLDAFARSASAGAPANGFSPAVAGFDRASWALLRDELSAAIPASPGESGRKS